MQMVSKAARRYANALLETAISEKSLKETEEDMLFVKKTIEDSADLKIFLRSPVIKKAIKLNALEAIFGGKVQASTLTLIRILSEKGRENLLLDICTAFLALHKKHHGIVDVDVQTAFTLTDDQTGHLHRTLESVTGKKVDLYVTLVKELKGGLTVRIDDTVIDGSVKYKLNRLKEKFTAATVE